jgi:hypothetical protein
MEERVYEDYTINFSLSNLSRVESRNKIVGLFLSEKGGYWKDGKKYVTRYQYFVETLKDGRQVYLLRPTFLNKGIDFQVWVEKFDGEKNKKPSHKDIFHDLKVKKEENPEKFKTLIQAIDDVWNSQEPDNVLKKSLDLTFKNGFSSEMLLKILKWLFIEQDITYWNYDGRAMLRRAIDEETS